MIEEKVKDLLRRVERLETIDRLYIGGDIVFYDDFRVPVTAINPPGIASDPTFDLTYIGYLFSATSTNVLFIIVQMPHTWQEGSTIEPHVHWSPTNTNTGNVYWRLEYEWVNIDDVQTGTFTTVNLVTPADGTAYKHQLSSFGGISGAGKTASSILSIILSRIGGDAADTYNAEALLKEFDIHYAQDSLGERETP